MKNRERIDYPWSNEDGVSPFGWERKCQLVEQDHHLDSWLVSTAFSGKHVGLATLKRNLTSFVFFDLTEKFKLLQKSSIESPTPPNKSLIGREVSRALLFFGGAGVRKGWKNLEKTLN